MKKIFKSITAAVVASAMVSGTVANAATNGGFTSPVWAEEDYTDASMMRTCSVTVGKNYPRKFEGVMGVFAKSPHSKYILETGTSASLVGSAQYETSAYCVYVDSSGNEQNYDVKGSNKQKITFYTVGPYQMFYQVTGAHVVTYDNEKRGGATQCYY